MTALTQIQADTLDWIKVFIKNVGFPPSRNEIAEGFNINPNAAQARVKGLIKKGALTHTPGAQRSIVPVKGFKVNIKEREW